jgi:hypothetical protein
MKAPAVLMALATGGFLASASLVAAPPALACPEGQLLDNVTRMCWSQTGQGQAYGGPGEGPCLPGRVGGCIGTLQKGEAHYIPVPGAVTDW